VSNPPYFTNSLLPPAAHRSRARHTEHLTYPELIIHSLRLLTSTGTLAMILPVQEGHNFKQLAFKNGLFVKRQLAFYSRKEKTQERWLFEFGFRQDWPKEESLILYEKENLKSSDYINLTKDFYL
jgi:tRNA1Val (adenine37-N6)-methyltransferase